MIALQSQNRVVAKRITLGYRPQVAEGCLGLVSKIDARISFDIAGHPELLDLFNAISPQKELRYTSMFVTLCIARQMLKAVRSESKWADRLKSLLADYPEVPLAAMGFPSDWQTLALWQ